MTDNGIMALILLSPNPGWIQGHFCFYRTFATLPFAALRDRGIRGIRVVPPLYKLTGMILLRYRSTRRSTLANFVSISVVKSAVRTLTTEIPTFAAFSEVVDDIMTTNPFDCTDYEVGSVSHDGMEKTGSRTRPGSRTRITKRSRSAPRRSSARRLPRSTAW